MQTQTLEHIQSFSDLVTHYQPISKEIHFLVLPQSKVQAVVLDIEDLLVYTAHEQKHPTLGDLERKNISFASFVQKALVLMVSGDRKISIVSRGIREATMRTMRRLGVSEEIINQIYIESEETLRAQRSSKAFYEKIAKKMSICPKSCVVIGSDTHEENHPAIEAQMGAIMITHLEQLFLAFEKIFHTSTMLPISLEAFALREFIPGKIKVIGLAGRSGAGKTTTTARLKEIYQKNNIPTATLGIDLFFSKSRAERTAWLEEGKHLSAEEYAFRCDMMNWWDFDKFTKAINDVRAGKKVYLEGVFNRADEGRMTGIIDIDPKKLDPEQKGMILIVEGIATAHLKQRGDTMVYLATHPTVRKERQFSRDAHRTGAAAEERFLLMNTFEKRYFGKHADKIDFVIENSGGQTLYAPYFPQL